MDTLTPLSPDRQPGAWALAGRLAVWAAAIGACALVFAAYRQPAFLHTLADRLWSCF